MTVIISGPAAFLRANRPHAFCAGCLALQCSTGFQAAQELFRTFEGVADFSVAPGDCSRCGRALEVIAAR